jgi:TRAP-type mannitol/chloroaromatic compound transport system permease small subunit
VNALLAFARAIDAINTRFGMIANLCVLVSCLISAGNALTRYGFNLSSNAWLEIQWYLFGAMFMLGAAHTLRVNGHVRVDILYGALSRRGQIWIDLLGTLVFLLPATVIIGWMSWPVFVGSWRIGEVSNNAGGLLRWPIKLFLPLGFALLSLQGVSEVIKRIAALKGRYELPQYEKIAVQ